MKSDALELEAGARPTSRPGPPGDEDAEQAADRLLQYFFMMGPTIALLLLLGPVFFTKDPTPDQRQMVEDMFGSWCSDWKQTCDAYSPYPISATTVCALDPSSLGLSLSGEYASQADYVRHLLGGSGVPPAQRGGAGLPRLAYLDGMHFMAAVYACGTAAPFTAVSSLGECAFNETFIRATLDLSAVPDALVDTCNTMVQVIENVSVLRAQYFQVCHFPTIMAAYSYLGILTLAFTCLSFMLYAYGSVRWAYASSVGGAAALFLIGLVGVVELCAWPACFFDISPAFTSSMFVLFLVLMAGSVLFVAIGQIKLPYFKGRSCRRPRRCV